jgi:peptidoglycan/xylan/chitin deacetylase (PgdA/CDA1 family)
MMSALTPAVAGFVGCAMYYAPYASRLCSVSALRKRLGSERTLVLTYDDGPSTVVTPAVLELLRRSRAKATFFMLGRSAEQNARVADRVLEEGHDIGCHSDQHLNAWKIDPWTAVADINAGYEKLNRWLSSNGIYRPPYGKITLATHWAVRRRGAQLGWWTIDSGDTHDTLPSPSQVLDRVLRENGGVVLMHDLDRTGERNDFVLETTALLLDLAKRESIKIKTLSEVCP